MRGVLNQGNIDLCAGSPPFLTIGRTTRLSVRLCGAAMAVGMDVVRGTSADIAGARQIRESKFTGTGVCNQTWEPTASLSLSQSGACTCVQSGARGFEGVRSGLGDCRRSVATVAPCSPQNAMSGSSHTQKAGVFASRT